MNNLKKILLEKMPLQNFDTLAVAIIDFKKCNFEYFLISSDDSLLQAPLVYFDLASITKPLTLHLAYLIHKEQFRPHWHWLLHHRAGLPAYAWLDKGRWREQVKSYHLHQSDTLYSDLSAMRLGTEIEENLGLALKDFVRPHHDQEMLHWSVLAAHAPCPGTGFRNGKEIRCEVHDPRANLTHEYMAHAGLFSTIQGMSRTILDWQKKFSFIERTSEFIKQHPDQRFALGWDRAQDPKTSLAGPHYPPLSFGHTGFVGNMIWISPELQRGVIVLSNATQNYWYAKQGLNELRRSIASYAWTGNWQ